MSSTLAETEYQVALRTARDDSIPAGERAEMLMEIALGLQRHPRRPEDLEQVNNLYKEGLQVCPDGDVLLRARLLAGQATALLATPGDTRVLEEAVACLRSALPVLQTLGSAEEVAETEMNEGLALQGLAVAGKVSFPDAVTKYHSALRIFTADKFPREYAIIHNNLATAYLSMTMGDEASKMREALAVQSYESALRAVTLDAHPTEYAMLQNNLGNALQYSSSAHPVENNLRALEAYREALRVRTPKERPEEYANTISNMANALRNLPDDPENPELGNIRNLGEAARLYETAEKIFMEMGEMDKSRLVRVALDETLALLSEHGSVH
ncbi:hypothetical protein ACSDBR_13355 [Acidithiobacillus ferriphilus]|uniref:Tetratricopeptide repeat protein n=2 Tax=Acidithiobacillus TaxID=119977 RepID=A0A5P9XQE8_ACITH|nr:MULTISPECIES: hypothetical protein [Acidithiobacillus]MDD5537670.1 hypothetical protein [Candidatus Omnitrophota bacterium]MBU2813414.1 hypothetical protein [Acidithiobacillus ferruginosus]MBU2832148.1 hypothetical protein [Acidithiobacillus ferriphilus]MCR2828745.1 hypothetical protein [Acidithiobacillus ferrooxidans]QFX96082.1 hypothetical protein GCD22_01798 [Acidithiobacillus thiooxidans ATCC 19377]